MQKRKRDMEYDSCTRALHKLRRECGSLTGPQLAQCRTGLNIHDAQVNDSMTECVRDGYTAPLFCELTGGRKAAQHVNGLFILGKPS